MRFRKDASIVVITILSGLILIFIWQVASFQIKLRLRRSTVRTALLNPEMYKNIGNTLAQLCQSATSNVRQKIDALQLPAELLRTGPMVDAYYDKRYAGIVMGGGWFHYGYVLRLNEQTSTTRTNVWDLYVRVEDDSSLKTVIFSAITATSSNHSESATAIMTSR